MYLWTILSGEKGVIDLKVIMSMRSGFSFNRIKKTLESDPTFNEVSIYEINVEQLNDLKDVVEINNPNLYILDKTRQDWEELWRYVNTVGQDYLYFEGDYDDLKNQMIDFFELEVQEDQTDRKSINYLGQEEAKEKIVYRDRIVEKEIIKTEYTSIPNTQVAIINLWQGAGATTLSMNLARGIAKRGLNVGVIESPIMNPYIFDYLQVIKHEEINRNFKYVDLAQQVKENSSFKFKGEPFRYKGIDWFVNDSRLIPVESYELEDYLRVILSINSTIQILDLSNSAYDSKTKELLKHMDHVLVILEPDPVKLDWLSELTEGEVTLEYQRKENQMLHYLEELSSSGIEYDFILNKYTHKSDMREFISSLPRKPIGQIPVFSYDELNKCVWDSSFLYDLHEDDLDKSFIPIYSKFLPKDYIKKVKREKKSLVDSFKKIKGITRREKEQEDEENI
jgi:hypothetical protein